MLKCIALPRILTSRLLDAPRLTSALWTSVAVNTLFAASHVVNVLFTSYTREYIVLQVVMGFVIGVSLSQISYLTGSIASSVMIHSINNVFAMFDLSQGDWRVNRVPYAITVFVYSCAIFYLHRHTTQLINQLDDTDQDSPENERDERVKQE